jgi:hypothetical protein
VWLAAEGQPTSPAVLVDCGACADCVGYVRLAQRTAIRFDPNPPHPHTHPHTPWPRRTPTPIFFQRKKNAPRSLKRTVGFRLTPTPRNCSARKFLSGAAETLNTQPHNIYV